MSVGLLCEVLTASPEHLGLSRARYLRPLEGHKIAPQANPWGPQTKGASHFVSAMPPNAPVRC